ncbi:MAG TPA: stage II sporulation protein R [Clostridiales bacterium]|nr:stage II sporulation protein R [Clostridiales bacterium]
MNTKKKILILLLLCLVLTLVCAASINGSRIKDASLIRFHVIANSDSVCDQAVKLKVRDAVLEQVNDALSKAASKEEAAAILSSKSDAIIDTANAVLTAEGFSYTATAKLGTSVFPTKTYGSITLPAGKYNAYRIILGEGKGKNWWCVLYPPLCFVDITDDVSVAVTRDETGGETPDVVPAAGQPYEIKIKSKFLEFLGQ